MFKLLQNLSRYPLRQEDDFARRAFSIAVPLIIQQMIVCSVNLLDNLMVGQLGELAISGVAAANKFFIILDFAFFGLTGAAGIYMSQFHGAKEYRHLRESYLFGLLSSILVTLFFVIPGLLFPGIIGGFFTSDPGIQAPVRAYMPLAALALIPHWYSFNAQNAMRVLGETKKPLIISIVAVVSNGIFNSLFIFGLLGLPALGVTGAALGTLCARTVEFFLTVWFVKSGDFDFKRQAGDPLIMLSPRVSSVVFKRAIPLTLNEMGFGTGMAILFKFYGTRGLSVLAAMNITGTVSEIFFVLFSGMAVATTVIVGQELGAGKLEVARSSAYRLYKLSFLTALLFSGLMLVSSFIFPYLYNVSDEVRSMAIFFIRIYAAFYLVYAVNSQAYFTLRAGGDTKHVLMMDAGIFWFVNLPVVGLAAYCTDWSVFGLFIAGQMTDLVKFLVSSHLLSKETWVQNLTTDV